MKTQITMAFLILTIFQSCSKEKNDKTINKPDLIVNLKNTVDDNVKFSDLYNTITVNALNVSFPNYYKTQLNYKGIANKDSMMVSTLNTDYYKFIYDMYKQGFINKDKFIKSKIDSTSQAKKPEQRQLLVAVKFDKTKQYLIVDENNNKDFTDDKINIFDKDFRISANYSSKTKNLPLYNFRYWNKNNNDIIYHNRKIVVYPSLNDVHFRSSNNEIQKKSRLIMKFKDYWKGVINYKNNNYQVAIQGFYNSFLTILIRPDSLKFSKNNSNFSTEFSYKIKDTVVLSNQSFIIDSVTDNLTQLYLKKIDTKYNYGFGLGSTIKNFELINLDGSRDSLYAKIKNKKYTLLDFWGTWCKPCRELTPELKKMKLAYSKNLNLLSIAYDNDVKDVQDYTTKNNMNWIHAFAKRGSKWPYIIRQLRIKAYPSFILLDNNNKIIYRGVGGDALEAIKKIIAKEN